MIMLGPSKCLFYNQKKTFSKTPQVKLIILKKTINCCFPPKNESKREMPNTRPFYSACTKFWSVVLLLSTVFVFGQTSSEFGEHCHITRFYSQVFFQYNIPFESEPVVGSHRYTGTPGQGS
jgi:hypothetical protein